MRTLVATMSLVVCMAVYATPSTLVSIPSTDIQPKGIYHLGSDTFLPEDGSGAATSDIGLTYGLDPRVEIGVDNFSGTVDPLTFNAKVLITPMGSKVPVAVGISNLALKKDSAWDQQMVYIVGSYVTDAGPRVTFGGYTSNENIVGSPKDGILLGVDYQQGKWWYGIDYISGENGLGTVNPGVGYNFADNVGVILGYDKYNNSEFKNTMNLQVDINF